MVKGKQGERGYMVLGKSGERGYGYRKKQFFIEFNEYFVYNAPNAVNVTELEKYILRRRRRRRIGEIYTIDKFRFCSHAPDYFVFKYNFIITIQYDIKFYNMFYICINLPYIGFQGPIKVFIFKIEQYFSFEYRGRGGPGEKGRGRGGEKKP